MQVFKVTSHRDLAGPSCGSVYFMLTERHVLSIKRSVHFVLFFSFLERSTISTSLKKHSRFTPFVLLFSRLQQRSSLGARVPIVATEDGIVCETQCCGVVGDESCPIVAPCSVNRGFYLI